MTKTSQATLYGATRADELFTQFRAFHEAHPELYRLFRQYADRARQQAKRYSAVTIFELLRWHVDIGSDSSSSVKLNNNFTAWYARMYMADRNCWGFFRTRQLRSRGHLAAGKLPSGSTQQLGPDDWKDTEHSDELRRLARLEEGPRE